MNRLLRKLKEFGLIFAINQETELDTITICRSLKRADIPVGLFNYSRDQQIDQVRISNENEDMFIGARCTCELEEIKSALASGAHFVLTPFGDEPVIKKCLSDGYDLIVEVCSENEIDLVKNMGVEAVEIDCGLKDRETLIEYAASVTDLTLFLRGKKGNLPIDKWKNHKKMAAFIIDNNFKAISDAGIYTDAQSMLHQLMGIKYISLSIKAGSKRLNEASIFSSLSVIPLFTESDRDLLTIAVSDMDRMIAHLKWKNIYMDPLSAKMNGEAVMETELYTEFLGWNVKLISYS
jgi:KDPG and KHG aldolase